MSRQRIGLVVRDAQRQVAVEIPDRSFAMAARVALAEVAGELEVVEAGMRLHVERAVPRMCDMIERAISAYDHDRTPLPSRPTPGK